MHPITELLLVSAREADLERAATSHRLRSLLESCRRRLLGIVPIGPACEPC